MSPTEHSRRQAIGLAGVGGLGILAGTTACGDSDAGGDLVQTSEIPVGGGTIITPLKVVVTQPTDGDFKAFSVVCPHQGCPVSDVEDGQIICRCHGSTFDIATGEVTKGPATSGLTPKSVSVGADGLRIT